MSELSKELKKKNPQLYKAIKQNNFSMEEVQDWLGRSFTDADNLVKEIQSSK